MTWWPRSAPGSPTGTRPKPYVWHKTADEILDSDAYNSLGGFVFAELRRSPRRGDTVTANGFSIRVESVRDNRIEAVPIREHRPRPPAEVRQVEDLKPLRELRARGDTDGRSTHPARGESGLDVRTGRSQVEPTGRYEAGLLRYLRHLRQSCFHDELSPPP